MHGGGRGDGPFGGGGGDGGGHGFADQVVNSALRYRAQAPIVDQLLREIGMQGGDVASAARGLLAPADGPDGSRGVGDGAGGRPASLGGNSHSSSNSNSNSGNGAGAGGGGGGGGGAGVGNLGSSEATDGGDGSGAGGSTESTRDDGGPRTSVVRRAQAR